MPDFLVHILESLHLRPRQEDFVSEAHAIREQQSERQIDKTVEDTFPASDPPAWY